MLGVVFYVIKTRYMNRYNLTQTIFGVFQREKLQIKNIATSKEHSLQFTCPFFVFTTKRSCLPSILLYLCELSRIIGLWMIWQSQQYKNRFIRQKGISGKKVCLKIKSSSIFFLSNVEN